MVRPVDNNNRPQGTGAKAIDVLDREKAIFSDPPGFYLELGAGLVEQKLCLPHMTSRARADGEQMFHHAG